MRASATPAGASAAIASGEESWAVAAAVGVAPGPPSDWRNANFPGSLGPWCREAQHGGFRDRGQVEAIDGVQQTDATVLDQVRERNPVPVEAPDGLWHEV